MAAVIDIVILALFIYYFYRGWKKGFLGSLLGPISLIIGCIMSYAYFQKTQNIMVALSISLLSPIFLHIVLIGFTKLYCLTPDKKQDPSTASRFVGGTFSLGWSGGFLVLIIFMVMVMSSILPNVARAKQGLAKTKTYKLINHFAGNIDFEGHHAQFKELSNSLEYQKLMADEKFKGLVTDPEIQQYIKEGNIAELVKDKRMHDVFSNKEMVSDLFDFQKKIISDSMTLEIPEDQFKDRPLPKQTQSNKTSNGKKRTPTPRIIEIEPKQ